MRPASSLVSAGARPALLALSGGAAVLAVLAGLRALQAPALPSPGVWAALVGLAPLAQASLLLPLALLVALVAPLQGWRVQGAWGGALASGLSGRRLLPLAVGMGLLGAVLSLAATTGIEPWARREARRLLVADGGGLELVPGRTVEVGALELRPLQGAPWVLVEVPEGLGLAREARLVRAEDALALELRELHLGTAWGEVRARRWLWPLAPPPSPRIELGERSTADLARAVERTERSGRDASYERAVLLKRFLHPLAVLLLPLVLVPVGLREHPWIRASLLGVGWLVATRIGDHLAPVLGALPSASAGLVWLLVWALIAWASWRER